MQVYQHWLSEQQQNMRQNIARCEARRQLMVKKSKNKLAECRKKQINQAELRELLKEQQNHEILIESHNKKCADKKYKVPLYKRPAVPLDSSDGTAPSSDRFGPSPRTASQPRHTNNSGPTAYPDPQLPLPLPDNHSTVDMDISDGSDDEEDDISIVLPQPVHAAQPGEPSSEKNTRYFAYFY